jgi:tetratricopeptide (TPR) repeat protein
MILRIFWFIFLAKINLCNFLNTKKLKGSGMRRGGRFLKSGPSTPTLDDVSKILTELEKTVAEDYLHFYQQACNSGCRVSQDIASTELLKYFRILPSDYMSKWKLPPVFKAAIEFITARETGPGVLADEDLFHLGLCYLVIGDVFRAFHTVSKMRSESITPDVAFVIGFCCFSFSRFDMGLKYLTIAENSTDSIIQYTAIFCKAVILQKEGSFAQSLAEWTRLLSMSHPFFTERDIKFHRAIIFFHMNHEREYQSIMDELDCDTVILQRVYFEALRSSWDAAIRYGSRMKSFMLTFDSFLLSAFVKYKQGLYWDAYGILWRVFKQESVNQNVWFLMGMIFARARHLNEAATVLNNANVLRPGNVLIEKNLGAVLEQCNRWDDAELVYRKMADCDRLVGYANYRLAQMAAFRNRAGEYEPPEIEEITISALVQSPADQKLLSFQSSLVYFSKETLSFLGDVEPEVMEVHRSMTRAWGVEDERDLSFDCGAVLFRP